MKITYMATLLNNSSNHINFSVNEISLCPMCKTGIKPTHLNSVYKVSNSGTRSIYSHFLCPNCKKSFIADTFAPSSSSSTHQAEDYSNIAPNSYVEEHFDDTIVHLSEQFIKIYNQALAAETSNLDEIAGLGYRKAMEFLIKDFAIHCHPSEEETIKSMSLTQCTNTYIDAPNIKTLATRSAWIGNDEAHYIRKQENRDVHDMKAFIKATVYFISMILITEDAASMEPAR